MRFIYVALLVTSFVEQGDHMHILCMAFTVCVPNLQHHTIRKILLALDQILDDIWRGTVMREVFQNLVVAAKCGGM